MSPNSSIERTWQRPLRALCPAAHVERYVPRMTAGAGPLDHLQALCSLVQELGTDGVALESYEYEASAFGSFVVVLARGHAKAKFIWAGKESVLTVEYMKAGSSGIAGTWTHDAYIQVPEQRDVFAEIGSNAVAMLV